MTIAPQTDSPTAPIRPTGTARVLDRLSLIAAVLWQLIAGGATALVGVLGAFAFDGCSGRAGGNIGACQSDLFATGVYSAVLVIGASLIATLALGIVFWVRGRLVWPVAAAGAALATLALVAAILIQLYASRPI